MSPVCMTIRNCLECPNYDHSGSFTEGGAYPLCNAMKGKKYHFYRKKLPWVMQRNHKGNAVRKPTGVIPDWCPLK